MNVAVLCGGVGAARFMRGLVEVVDPQHITAIVNTADDMVLHGLAISPDLDTCTYTLADAINPETGWGLVDETWQAMEVLERYGGQTWFGLGDRDLGTHLFRTQRLAEGVTLTQVTAEIARAWGIGVHLLPMSNDPVRTELTLDSGEVLEFQRYFVERRHRDTVVAVRFEGAPSASAAPGVVDAIGTADVVVVAPSNPIVSIAPLLAIDDINRAVAARRDSTVAISPIVDGDAVKGPAADLLRSMGHEVSAVGVARIHREIAGHMVLDRLDADLADALTSIGVRAHVTDTMMRSVAIAADLAQFTVDAVLARRDEALNAS